MDFHHLLGRPNAIDSSQGLAEIASSCCLHQGPVLIDEVKGDFRMGQAEAIDQVDDMGQLCLLALDVFEAGRRVVKEIFHRHLGPNRPTDGLFLYDIPPMGQQKPTMGSLCRGCLYSEVADRGNGGQGLSSKTKGPNPKEVGLGLDFTGCMATQGQLDLIWRNPSPIVRDFDGFETSFLNADGNLARTCIDGIFHQLLDHTGRPLNDLPSSNLVGQDFWQFDNLTCFFLLVLHSSYYTIKNQQPLFGLLAFFEEGAESESAEKGEYKGNQGLRPVKACGQIVEDVNGVKYQKESE